MFFSSGTSRLQFGKESIIHYNPHLVKLHLCTCLALLPFKPVVSDVYSFWVTDSHKIEQALELPAGRLNY